MTELPSFAAHAPVGAIRTDPSGQIESANDRAQTLLDADPPLAGQPLTEVYPRSASDELRAAFADPPVEDRSFEEYYPALDRWLAVDIVAQDGVLVYLRDRTTRNEYRQQLEDRDERLRRLQRLDAVIASVLQSVLTATDSDDVVETVCRQLGESDLYAFTWAGEVALGGDGLQLVAAAGDAPDLQAELETQLAEQTALPEQTAVSTAEAVFVDNIGAAEALPDPLRVAAFAGGLQSYIAVPLRSQETAYGVLCVYSAREGGFSEQERESLRTLGDVGGFVLSAMRRETLLDSTTVTLLDLRVEDQSVPLSSAEVGEVELVGSVQRDDDALICYVRADPGLEAALENTVAQAETDTDAERVRVVEDGAQPLYEVTLSGRTPLTVVTGWGGTVRSATYTPDGVELTVALPQADDIRQLVETLQAAFRSACVLSKERAESVPTTGRSRSDIEERLTDKQRRVFRTAYLADYFESPRGTSAEELADTLDLSGPTVLYHLRRTQHKIADWFFDD